MWATTGAVVASMLLAGTPGTPGTPRTPGSPGTPGSAGIGDPYFPRDGNGGIDVLHYDIHDGYSFRSGRLSGRTRLDVRATQDLSRFDLDFLLPVSEVTVDGVRADFRQVGDHELRITPATTLASGSQFRVKVEYAGRPATLSSQGESNWLADAHEVVTMNEPHMATWWFPADDHPTDKATYDITVSVPQGHRVIANGTQVARTRQHGRVTTTWRESDPMASYLAYFAAGRFDVRTGSTAGIPWTVAVYDQLDPDTRASLMPVLRRSGEITAWLQSVLGAYPFSSTGGLVTSLPVGFALENQTRPTYPVFSPDYVELVVHELAHQWFGDSVSVADWSQIWVNEGFAQFVQHYFDETHGGATTQAWLEKDYAALRPRADFWTVRVDDPGPQRVFDAAVYDRGAMTLQALRHLIGDDTFFTLLRTWAGQHRYGNGTVAEFESLAAQLSGRDLDRFFRVWLHARRPPAHTAANGF